MSSRKAQEEGKKKNVTVNWDTVPPIGKNKTGKKYGEGRGGDNTIVAPGLEIKWGMFRRILSSGRFSGVPSKMWAGEGVIGARAGRERDPVFAGTFGHAIFQLKGKVESTKSKIEGGDGS